MKIFYEGASRDFAFLKLDFSSLPNLEEYDCTDNCLLIMNPPELSLKHMSEEKLSLPSYSLQFAKKRKSLSQSARIYRWYKKETDKKTHKKNIKKNITHKKIIEISFNLKRNLFLRQCTNIYRWYKKKET